MMGMAQDVAGMAVGRYSSWSIPPQRHVRGFPWQMHRGLAASKRGVAIVDRRIR